MRLKSSPYATIVDICEEQHINPAYAVDRFFELAGVESTAGSRARFRTGAIRITPPLADAISAIIGSTPEFWQARDAQYAASRGRPVTTGPRKPSGRPRGRPVTKGPRVRVPRVNKAVNLNIRVTADLAAAIAAAAELAGCTPAEAARRALLDVFTQTPGKSST